MSSGAVSVLKSLCRRNQGVDIVGFAPEVDGVTPERAWGHVVRMESKPSLVLPDESIDKAGHSWWKLAHSEGLLSNDATCLISVSGVALGSWARIRLPERAPVLDIFSVNAGSPEFIAMNEEGRIFLAVTAEEDEIWLYLVKRSGGQWLTVR